MRDIYAISINGAGSFRINVSDVRQFVFVVDPYYTNDNIYLEQAVIMTNNHIITYNIVTCGRILFNVKNEHTTFYAGTNAALRILKPFKRIHDDDNPEMVWRRSGGIWRIYGKFDNRHYKHQI